MEEGYNAVTELLDRNVEAGRGHKAAFIDRTRTLTYGELQRDTCRVANLLTGLGIRREQRIAMIMLDTAEWPAVFLGAMRAGVVPVALNTLLATADYAYVLEDSRAAAVFVSAPLLATVRPAAEAAGTQNIFVVGEGAEGRERDFAADMARQPDAFATVATHPDETAFWLYSSGSTGRPKGVRHCHTSPMETARLFGQGILGLTADDVVFSASKLFFAYGLGNSLSFPMSVGATAVLHDGRPTPAALFEVMKAHQPTVFCGAPTGYAAILADPSCTPESGSGALRLCASASEPLPEHLGLRWEERFGCPIIDGVGSTEMLHIYLSNAPGDVAYGTSGRPVPGYEVRLVDEAGGDVAGGEIGELLVAGPTMAEGYWNQRAKSRATFEGTWMRTGDKFLRRPDGHYVYCGRADDMFKVSGQWVSPAEVESALTSHPDVLDAAVVAHKDDDRLLKPKAFVVARNNHGNDLEERLKVHVRETISSWKSPRWIEFVDALPKTATDKIQRFKLRED